MTFDADQAARVKRANAAPYRFPEPKPAPRPNGNRAVSLIVAGLGAACALGMLAAI